MPRKWIAVSFVLAAMAPVLAQSQATNGKIDAKVNCRVAAGSYFLDLEADGFGTFPGLLTLTAVGGVVATEAMDFESPGIGSWKTVGRREIKIRFLYFGFDETGANVFIGKVTYSAKFDKRCRRAFGPFEIEFFGPEQDPLDPDEAPFFVNTGAITMRRIAVE